MGSLVVLKNPNVVMNLMIRKDVYPQIASSVIIGFCAYDSEETVKIGKGDNATEWVCLKNVKSVKNGTNLGDLLTMVGEKTIDPGAKIYVTFSMKRKGKKKNAGKDRKEIDQGSNSGAAGESAGNSGSGQVDGSAGDRTDIGADGANDLWESPRVE